MASVRQTALRALPPIETADPFAADILAGLSAKPKRLPPKYFYDAAGSALFERITQLPEYYPTRCELELLRENAPAIASLFPPACALIEFGAGSSRKARILLGAAATVEAYVPVDISGDFLQQDAAQLRRDFPHLAVYPVVGDFTQSFVIPAAIAALPRVGFFPGSTIGNFEPHEAAKFLRHAGAILGHGAVLVIGVDLVKDTKILLPGLQRRRRRNGQIQSQSVGAHQSRAWRQFRPGHLRASRLLQPPAQPDRDASRQYQAAEGRESTARRSVSAPAKPSIPRTATNTPSSRFRRWREAAAGCRCRSGPTEISACTRCG